MCLAIEPTPKCHFVPRLPSESPEILTTGTPTILGAHNFACRPPIEMRSKTKFSLHWELSNNMSHATYTQRNRVDSWLLVVESQIVNLTPGLSFGYNLCVKCPNGSCEPISDIYVPRSFQWYKELFNPMGFDPCNCSLKIWDSTGTPTPKVGIHLGVWGFIPSHSLAFLGAWNMTPGLPS
jgi:hypothetical protein